MLFIDFFFLIVLVVNKYNKYFLEFVRNCFKYCIFYFVYNVMLKLFWLIFRNSVYFSKVFLILKVKYDLKK